MLLLSHGSPAATQLAADMRAGRRKEANWYAIGCNNVVAYWKYDLCSAQRTDTTGQTATTLPTLQ